DLRIALDSRPEIAFFLPSLHRVRLHYPIRLFAQHARRGQIQQQLAGEYQPFRHFQVAPHAVRIDQHLIDEVDGFVQQVVGQDRRIRQDHAFYRRVRDVTLVPEGDVLESRLHVGAHDAGETADL